MSTVTETLTLVPSGYTGLTSLTTSSSYPISNAYKGSGDTSTYARLSLSTSTTGYLYLTFDTSGIPSGATITGVSGTVTVRVSSTSRVTSTVCQLYSGTTAKGSNVTFASTSTSNTVTLTPGTWTASELGDLRLRIGGTGSSSSQSKYIYLYGATITVSYTVAAHDITISNSTSATVTASEGAVAEGGSVDIYADTLSGITVTDNGVDVTNQFVQGGTGTTASYPTSYTTSGSISGTNYQDAIGKGSDTASASGNDYCSSQGSTAYIEYSFADLNVPSGATIQSVSVSVKGHCENASQSSEVAQCQLYSGSTAKGDSLDFTSTSDTVYNMTVGTWTAAELESAKLRFTIGYYGGRLVGATWTVTYELDGYIYTISNVVADHAIVVAYTSSGPELYVKLNGSWAKVSKAFKKVGGAWQQVALDAAFESGVNYVRSE